MISFASDYLEGAHPAVLDALVRTNLEQLSGYGTDAYCESAKKKIRDACGCPEAEVFFVAGGTQTNQLVISTVLRGFEGVIAAKTGHISVHEAGAIEFTGHKVMELPSREGKLDADAVRDYISGFYADENHEHMPFPGMVYISYPTEYGTLYSRRELEALHAVCRDYSIPLFVDGARLGYGLASLGSDVTLPDLATLCDVFYIGGTKVGAVCGEAVVFCGVPAPAHFVTMTKQRGAMLAKGRLIGVQFDALFTGGLYFEIGRRAIEMTEKLKAVLRGKGLPFFIDSPTNQQFVILKNSKLDELKDKVGFSYWEKYDDSSTVVRFATSWATTDEQLEYLESVL